MEKAYTRLSLEQIQKELKKSIEEKEALYNKWNEVEHLTKKDGSEFKNISRSFSNCSVGYDYIGRPQISVATWTSKNVWCDDSISLYDTFSAYGKNKYPEDSYNMGGGVLAKYHVLTISETSASTEKVLKDHGFKFDHNKCMYAAAQTNDLRLFVAHDLDKLFNYDIQLFFNTEAKKELFAPDIQEIKDICYNFKVYKAYIDILNNDLFKICKPGSKSLLFTYNTNSKTIDVFNRNKLQESYIYNNGKVEKLSIETAAPKKKKKAALTEQQKINKMLEEFPF